jgi:glycerol kinase
MADFVAAIDQGTTSTRCMIFNRAGEEVGKHQLEHQQIMPRAGWVEHNPVEIWERTSAVLQTVLNSTGLGARDLAALGLTNQRETTVVWSRRTGRPYYNAIVWQDTRTDRLATALDGDGRGDVIRHRAGMPPATYFSAGKIQWILENRRCARRRPRHRRHQRQPHDADGPRDPRLGRRAALVLRDPPADAAADPPFLRARPVRRHPR